MPAASHDSKRVSKSDAKKTAAEEMANILGYNSQDQRAMPSTQASKLSRETEQPTYSHQGLVTKPRSDPRSVDNFAFRELLVYANLPFLPIP